MKLKQEKQIKYKIRAKQVLLVNSENANVATLDSPRRLDSPFSRYHPCDGSRNRQIK